MGSSRQSFFGVTMGGEPGRQPSPSSSQRNPNHHHPIVPGAFGGSFANLYNFQMSHPVPVLSDDRSRTNRSGSGHPGDDLGSDDEGASQHGGGDGKGGSGPDLKKRKRNRQALSCSECKRRKIKCDRKIPVSCSGGSVLLPYWSLIENVRMHSAKAASVCWCFLLRLVFGVTENLREHRARRR